VMIADMEPPFDASQPDTLIPLTTSRRLIFGSRQPLACDLPWSPISPSPLAHISLPKKTFLTSQVLHFFASSRRKARAALTLFCSSWLDLGSALSVSSTLLQTLSSLFLFIQDTSLTLRHLSAYPKPPINFCTELRH